MSDDKRMNISDEAVEAVARPFEYRDDPDLADRVCQRCFALVAYYDQDKHVEWHVNLEAALAAAHFTYNHEQSYRAAGAGE